MKGLGRPISFLEIDLIWKKDAMYRNQKRLISKLLNDSRMGDSKRMARFCAVREELTNYEEKLLKDKEAMRYRSIIGSLLNLSGRIRLDLCVTASLLKMQVECPR